MKKITIIAAAVAAVLAGCSQKPAEVTGTVIDATMNNIVVVPFDSSDTLTFSTVEAEKIANDGIIIGDTAICSFVGKATPEAVVPATKVEVRALNSRIFPFGKWIQPVPGMEGMVQGIALNEDGTASSINMSTLEYSTWTMDRASSSITLNGKSIGNGETIDFSETYTVTRYDADSLVLTSPNATLRYGKSAE